MNNNKTLDQLTCQSWYYVEKWDQRGTKAKWFGKLPNLASVQSLVEDVRQAKIPEIVRVIAHNASPEELNVLRQLARPSGIQRIACSPDAGSETEAMNYSKLDRLSELRDYSIRLRSPDAYFQYDDTKFSDPGKRSFFLGIERDLQALDGEAWDFIKSEALPRLTAKDPSSSRGWQQLFDTLNEAKGYNHLVRIGCTNVKFIPRSTNNRIRTPDLRGRLASTNVLCEVKTVNVSEVEADRRNVGGVGTTKVCLEEGFFNKMLSDLQTASAQMLACSAEAGTRRIAYLVINFDDRLHECADEYRIQIEAYLAGITVPNIEVALDIKQIF